MESEYSILGLVMIGAFVAWIAYGAGRESAREEGARRGFREGARLVDLGDRSDQIVINLASQVFSQIDTWVADAERWQRESEEREP